MLKKAERARTFLKEWWPWIVYAVLLAVILGFAASLRFKIPQTPLFDGDSWGYLRPGFSKLTGGAFQHTFGRNFLYPAFVFVVLGVFGYYEALTVIQHLLGLLTGVTLALTWNVLCGLLIQVSGRARMAARFFGLLLVASYLFSRWPLLAEHTLRPESVFPLAVILSFLLNLSALHAGYVVRRPAAERWCLGLNFVVVCVAQALKPSFGFAFAAANLPLAVWLCRRGEPWRNKAWTAGLAAAVAALTLWLPERILARSDTSAITFFPTMLLTIHARPIHAQIVDDLTTGDAAPYSTAFLTDFNRGLERSLAAAAQPENMPWHSLGFNADYLIYRDSVFTPAFGSRQKEMAAFCKHYYWKTWRRRPGDMLAKIGAELRLVYNFRPGMLRIRRLLNTTDNYTGKVNRPLSYDYTASWVCAQNPSVSVELAKSIYGRKYQKRLQSLQRTRATIRQYPWAGYLNNLLDLLHFPLLLASLACGAAVAWWKRGALPMVVPAVLLCFAVNFAIFLTIAVAHSLGFTRYVENQRIITTLSEFAALLLIWQCAVLFLNRRAASTEQSALNKTDASGAEASKQ
jgi:hypothetical protein